MPPTRSRSAARASSRTVSASGSAFSTRTAPGRDQSRARARVRGRVPRHVRGARPLATSASRRSPRPAARAKAAWSSSGVGRDAVRRTTEITLRARTRRDRGATSSASTRTLGPQEFLQLELAAIPREDSAAPAASPDRFDDAIDALNARYRRFLRSCSRYTTAPRRSTRA